MRKGFNSILLALVFSLPALAQTDVESSTSTPDSTTSKVETKSDSIGNRVNDVVQDVIQKTDDIAGAAEASRMGKPYYFMGEWAPLDLIIPSKWGIAAGYNQSANRTWEFEYSRGSASVPFVIEDLGGITEDKFTLRRRHFKGGTFNFFYGLDYIRFRVRLGSDIMSRVGAGQAEELDVLETGTFGAHAGVGNRWAINENFIWGVDWFSWTQPLLRDFRDDPFLDNANDLEDKEDVREALRIVEYFPRLTILKLSLGYAF